MVQIEDAGTDSEKSMTLSKTITTAELMALDYRYDFSNSELWEDWQRLCKTRQYKTGSQFKPGMKLCQHFCDNFWQIENAAGATTKEQKLFALGVRHDF